MRKADIQNKKLLSTTYFEFNAAQRFFVSLKFHPDARVLGVEVIDREVAESHRVSTNVSKKLANLRHEGFAPIAW